MFELILCDPSLLQASLPAKTIRLKNPPSCFIIHNFIRQSNRCRISQHSHSILILGFCKQNIKTNGLKLLINLFDPNDPNNIYLDLNTKIDLSIYLW
jgi:hypothetical protein